MASSSHNNFQDSFDEEYDQFFDQYLDQTFENLIIANGDQEGEKKTRKRSFYRNKP